MPIVKKIKLGNKLIGDGEPVFIIAEIANAHNGDFETAKKMVDEIKGTGVDAVKFQLHIPSAEMTPDHPKFTTQGQRALSISQLAELKKYVEDKGLIFLCTPFSREAADQLESIGVDAFKIGSGEITNFPLLEYIAKKGKTMMVSTGMSTLSEIDEAVEILKNQGVQFLLFHTISIYPGIYPRLNLGVIRMLKDKYQCPVGFSDHTSEIFSAIASVSYGVNCIEKHYTLDREQQGTSDHKISLLPAEFGMLTDAVHKIEQACGSEKRIFEEEQATISWARQSVVAKIDIPAGAVIKEDMITTKRPFFDAIPAKNMKDVIGKKTKKDIPGNARIYWEDIEK